MYLRGFGKRKKITHYIGRILLDGKFIKAKHRKSKTAESAQTQVQLTKEELAVLTTLSMNGRATTPILSRISGLSNSAAYETARRLERRFGIQYMAEVDVEKLGYLSFLVLVKFIDRVPSEKRDK